MEILLPIYITRSFPVCSIEAKVPNTTRKELVQYNIKENGISEDSCKAIIELGSTVVLKIKIQLTNFQYVVYMY